MDKTMKLKHWTPVFGMLLFACSGDETDGSDVRGAGTGGSGVSLGTSGASGGASPTGGTSTGGTSIGGTSIGGTSGTASELKVVSVYGIVDFNLQRAGTVPDGVFLFGYKGTVDSSATYGPCSVISSYSFLGEVAFLQVLEAGVFSATSSEIPGTATMTIGPDNRPVFVGLDKYARGGEVIHVKASGSAKLPAFEADVEIPLAIIVQSPPVVDDSIRVPKGEDLVLTWERGAANTTVLLRGNVFTTGTQLICEFDSAAGTATIPAAALALNGGALLSIQTVAHKTVTVAGTTIETRGYYGARHKDIPSGLIFQIYTER